ncbi:hypothetical protein D6D25_07140 [Aureobasidium pullulans]|nr:hypothetical protein D6D25_07140 [Aureobasidium pullulans]
MSTPRAKPLEKLITATSKCTLEGAAYGKCIAADKYDVPSLRALVVDKIPGLMKQTWLTNQEEFCKAIRRLCAPDAVVFADKSLQASAASFCSTYISTLIKNDRFVQMLEEGEPFAGRLLTAVLKGQTSPLKKSPY